MLFRSEMRQALISNSLRDMGLLFEQQSAAPAIEAGKPKEPAALPEGAAIAGDYTEGEYQDPESGYQGAEGYQEPLPWEEPQEPQVIICADCGRTITETTGRNGKQWTVEAIKGFSEKKFGRCLCPSCQQKAQGGQRR